MNDFSELKDRDFAVDYLAGHLIEGTIVLFLGAGASKGFGLPSWIELANKLRDEINKLRDKENHLHPIPEDSSVETVQLGIDEDLDVIKHDEHRKIELISDLLYPSSLTAFKAYNNNLLVALSSLLIGRRRGHINKVVTYNYDSMLEWFLSLFGFRVNIIHELPSLEGSEDVRIYHPHGYIPHPMMGSHNSSKFLVFGMHDANKRLREGEKWRQKTKEIMASGVCLFVGMSGNSLTDRSISPIISEVGEMVKNERPLGIWVYKDDLTPSKDKEFLRNNIIAIPIQQEDDICDFVLEISRKSLEKVLALEKKH
ncbi:hypothetical protein HMPREF1990_01881 [Porphyromonas gingivalis W4087]|uniref:SIR2 family protein n=1 Tax=Porphyromonas gingivalis TaxID=837 RepID=UPI0003AD4E3B|nr:SIR2 family protein [Porphyromonas gingivalis]ERJ87064.1 hypothetical protein HMPREF1990_01881 [Porphyromonas gingivalis W4087]PDP63157.1 hypothetical protein CLI83_01895 [Porphyromonas gingivalis]PDP74958.1 hypothetical protein CLI79_06760 [Porphyromonas gingivalis]